jgi:YggT family protein
MNDDQRYVIRNEDTVEADPRPAQTTTSTSETRSDAVGAAPVAPVAANQATVQSTTTKTQVPENQTYSRNVAERVVDPAAERAAAVDWVNRLIWFIVGLMAILLVIRFVLLAAGANESAGFAQLIYGLTGWMVAPFAGLFGSPITYPGTAGTGIIEIEALVAAAVYLLIGWILTKLVELAIGTNRTRGTVYSETDHKTRV